MVPAIVAMALLVPAVATNGILAAIAVPSFVQYVRRSKTAEARANVQAIQAGLEAHVASERVGADGRIEAGGIPQLGPTPSSPPCDAPRPFSPDEEPAWSLVAFRPAAPVYFSYEVAPLAGGAYVIRARGDLDCDGVTSLYELRGRVVDGRAVPDGPVHVENELE